MEELRFVNVQDGWEIWVREIGPGVHQLRLIAHPLEKPQKRGRGRPAGTRRLWLTYSVRLQRLWAGPSRDALEMFPNLAHWLDIYCREQWPDFTESDLVCIAEESFERAKWLAENPSI